MQTTFSNAGLGSTDVGMEVAACCTGDLMTYVYLDQMRVVVE